tara:strand:- start:68 stop:181 length:114 start_codon:yes stop_codon:yes gene_type:complete
MYPISCNALVGLACILGFWAKRLHKSVEHDLGKPDTK